MIVVVDVATGPSERPGAVEDDPRSLLRKEDGRLLTGAARFVDNLADRGSLHATILRSSSHAHARVVTVDTGRARAHPRVVDVITAAEFAEQPVILILAGRVPDAAAAREAAAAAISGIEPTGDMHGSTRYRRELIQSLVERGIVLAAKEAA